VLAQTLFLIAMIALVATSAVAGIAGYARAETSTSAAALIAPAIETAIARYEATVIAPAIAAQFNAGDGSAVPRAAPALNGAPVWTTQTYVLAPAAPSPLAVVTTIVPTATVVPACEPAAVSVNSGPDVELDGQCSAFVQESRLSLTIAADAGPLAGTTAVTPLAHGRATVTLRLVAQPPYAMVAGISVDPAPGDPHEGDGGGYGNAVGAFGPVPGPDDTTIHVIFACTPALGDCSASHPPPLDAPTSLPWTNGNTN
jgi:hypothetical protein